MTEYHFNADLARKYGVDGAIFLHAMAFWVGKNQANGRHFHQGRTWTYNTQEALTKLFPFWSRRQIERITGKLREQGALLSGRFGADKTDRTLWYTLSDDVLETYGLLPSPIAPNGEMHGTEPGQPYHQTVQCNKETVTDQLNNIPPIVPQGDKPDPSDQQELLFERFWSAYPPRQGKRGGKKAARRAWDKLKPDLDLCRRMAAALDRDKCSPQWQEANGKYIPMASTWLNGRAWEDEYIAPPDQPPPRMAAREEVPTW